MTLDAKAYEAAHSLYRLTHQRPATDSPTVEPTQRWRSDCGKERVNVTGNSTRAVGIRPSWALGLEMHRSGNQMERMTYLVTLPYLLFTGLRA